MGREILFRGKRIDNGEWIEGFYVKHGSRHWIYTGEIQYMYLPVCAELPTKYEVEPEYICQYTGLADKNGRKIFEGDIVKTRFFGKDDGKGHNFCDYDIFKISYKDGAYKLENSKREFSASYIVDMKGSSAIEVIGNLWDTPELLNQ